MEEHTNNDTKVPKTSLSKRLKQHHSATDKPGLDDNNQRVATKSDSSKSLDRNSIGTLEISLNQQPTNTGMMNYKFVLPSEEDYNLVPDENFEPPLLLQRACDLGSTPPQALEEEHGSRGGTRCSCKDEISTWTFTLLRSTPRKVPGIGYFFRILETKGVTEICTPHKISSFGFLNQNRQGRNRRFGDKEIIHSF